MRAVEEVLGAISCPLAGSEAVAAACRLSSSECAEALSGWLDHVFALNLQLAYRREDFKPGDTDVRAVITVSDAKASVLVKVIADAEIEEVAAGEGRRGGVDNADVLVLALKVDPEQHAESVAALQRRAGAPSPGFIVMDPGWLAAAVIARSVPLAYGNLSMPGAHTPGSEPYFPEAPPGGSIGITRVTSSMRAAIGASVLQEARSLPEKFREEGSRMRPPSDDVVLVTTFLPPVTHARSALLRYYARDGTEEELVREQVDSRQDAERAAFDAQVSQHQYVLVLDREQLREYCAAPEYYQMVLTPDELDEQIANWLELFEAPSYLIALSPEPVDIPFTLQGAVVHLRGDRRNRSEPRAGRLNGLQFTDDAVAEEFRREAWSLVEMTEGQFKNKEFIAPWVRDLAALYRQSYRRRGL